MGYESECERTVKNGGRAVLGKSDSSERNKCDRERTFKGPVVGAVCRVGLGESGGVVDGTLDVGCVYEEEEQDVTKNVRVSLWTDIQTSFQLYMPVPQSDGACLSILDSQE